jgi:hypothetical protein
VTGSCGCPASSTVSRPALTPTPLPFAHSYGLFKPKVVFTIHNLNYGQKKLAEAADFSQKFTTVSTACLPAFCCCPLMKLATQGLPLLPRSWPASCPALPRPPVHAAHAVPIGVSRVHLTAL